MNRTNYYIIDDDEDDRDFLIEALSQVDNLAQCGTAVNGMDGIKFLEAQTGGLPDAIFLDQNMPGFSGKQCLKKLKENPVLNTIPVIIYSTSFNKTEMENILTAGAYRFLVKTSSFKELVETL